MSTIAIDTATREDDVAIEALLHTSYVNAGFTTPAEASLLKADAVFDRGHVYVARESGTVIGMVILVSDKLRLAKRPDVEMHLLAVAPSQRRHGVGRLLVNHVIEQGRASGAPRMLLWTQPAMIDAQRLYERHGFERAPELDFEKDEHSFLVYERRL